MNAPLYTFLLGEYVGRMEALLTYDKIPPEVKQSMKQRAAELKALKLTASDCNRLIEELGKLQHFQNPIPDEIKY
jgi:hypothetical protein